MAQAQPTPDQPRESSAFIRRASAQFPVVLVTGPRQVGKTSLLQALAQAPDASLQRAYVSLDDPLALRLARAEPALFLQRYSAPVLIDEIQYAPELFPHIKMAVTQRAGRVCFGSPARGRLN